MNHSQTVRALLACSALSIAGMAIAADRPDKGRREYQNNCASCHGVAAKGDGPMRASLLKPPADLTLLAQKNGGVFPMERVQQVIDGRTEIRSHGTREMPIWGSRYANIGNSEYFDVPFDENAYVAARIMLVADYLNRIQVK